MRLCLFRGLPRPLNRRIGPQHVNIHITCSSFLLPTYKYMLRSLCRRIKRLVAFLRFRLCGEPRAIRVESGPLVPRLRWRSSHFPSLSLRVFWGQGNPLWDSYTQGVPIDFWDQPFGFPPIYRLSAVLSTVRDLNKVTSRSTRLRSYPYRRYGDPYWVQCAFF